MNCITTKRQNYAHHFVIDTRTNRRVGRLISTPAGYQFRTRDPKLKFQDGKYWRTPRSLVNACARLGGLK